MTELLQALVDQTLDDVILYGVVDTNDLPADFIPILDRIYLVVGGSLVEIVRDESSVRLTAGTVTNFRVVRELENGMSACRSSIGKYVFADPYADNRIAKIIVYPDKDGAYRAIEIALRSGQTIFFDPSFIDGIKFGGVEQKAVWLANWESHETITIE